MRNQTILVALLLLVAGAVSAVAQAKPAAQGLPPAPEIKVRRLSPRVAVLDANVPGFMVSSIAIATQKGIVVIDSSMHPIAGKALREAIQKEFKRNDFAYLINSHEHTDHIGGNAAFEDIPIIGLETVRQRLLNDLAYARIYYQKNDPPVAETLQFTKYAKEFPANPEEPAFISNEKVMRQTADAFRAGMVLAPPTVTFDREMTLHMGDVTIRMVYYGPTHSLTDTLINIPEENLVISESLFSKQQIPLLGTNGKPVPTGTIRPTEPLDSQVVENWFALLHGLLDKADDRLQFISSHEQEPISRADMLKTLSYLEKLWREVQKARAEGKTLEQAQASLTLKDEFPDVANWRDEKNRGKSYQELEIHKHNVEFLWNVRDANTRNSSNQGTM